MLSLYDSTRLQGPRGGDGDVEWDAINAVVKAQLAGIQNSGKKAVLLTQTYAST